MALRERLDIIISAIDEATPVIQGLMAMAFGKQLVDAILAINDKAMKFNDSMKQMYVIGEVAVGQQNKLRKTIIDLSEAYGVSATELADMGTEIEAMGYTGEDAMNILRAATDLAIGGLSDLENATHALAISMKQYGIEATEVGHVADVFAWTANKTSLNVTEMNTAMSYAAPMAHQLGISIDETAAALGVTNNVIGIASKSGTSMRQMFAQLIDPTTAAKEAFTDVALEVESGSAFLNLLTQEGKDNVTMFKQLTTNVAKFDNTLLEAKAGIRDTRDDLNDAKTKVSELSTQLREAKRRLDELTRPELEGMEEFDDALFDVGQQINETKLKLVELKEKGVKDGNTEVVKLNETLEGLYLQQEKLELERKLTFDEQLRTITEAAEGTKEAMTFDEVMASIAATKAEISSLEEQQTAAKKTTADLEASLKSQTDTYDTLSAQMGVEKDRLKELESALVNGVDFTVRDDEGKTQLADTLERLQKATADLTEKERNELLMKLFGIRGIQAYNAMTSQGIDKLKELTAENEEASDTVSGLGYAHDVAAERMETTQYAVNKMMQSFEKLWIVVGSGLAPAIEVLAGVFDWLADFLAGIDPNILSLVAGFIALIGAGGMFVGVVAVLTTIVPGMIVAFNGIMAAIPPTLSLIAQVVAILAVLWAAFEVGMAIVGVVMKELTKMWEEDFGNIRTTTLRVLEVAKTKFDEAMKFIEGIVKWALGEIRKFWDEHGETIMAIVSAAIDFIKEYVEVGMKALTTIINVILDLIEGDTDKAWEDLTKGWEDWVTGVGGILDGLVTAVTDIFELLIKAAIDWGSDLVDNFVSGVKDTVDDAIAGVQEAADKLFSVFSFDKLANDMMVRKWGQDMVAQFNVGVSQAEPLASPFRESGSMGITESRIVQITPTIIAENVYVRDDDEVEDLANKISVIIADDLLTRV